jgi:hypothetical protein
VRDKQWGGNPQKCGKNVSALKRLAGNTDKSQLAPVRERPG